MLFRSMASQAMVATETIAHYGQPTGTTGQFDDKSQALMPADCPMLAQAADPADDNAPLAPTSTVCSSCDLCLAIAMTAAIQPPASPFIPQAAPLMDGSRFASADPLAGFKPPIS